MNDRELLEMAAKAIGTEIQVAVPSGKYFRTDTGHYWNPLEDDGDALRLAVRLELRMAAHCNNEQACAEPIHMPGCMVEDWGNDKYASMRRVIVMATAEIGKTMK